jgi:hypothetical protein
MRLIAAIIVVVYLVGVGVALSPAIRHKWDTATAADLTRSIALELPYALKWPVRFFRNGDLAA